MRWSLLSLLLMITSCSLWKSSSSRSPSEELTHLRQTHDLPALAAALSLDNQMLFLEAQGFRKIDSPVEVTVQDKFHLGSCTKAMTATLVAKFIERGHFDWTSKVSSLLPHIKFHDSFKDLTIEDLLSHFGGLSTNPTKDKIPSLKKLKVTSARREVARIYLSDKPEFIPQEFHYSNVGYIILGHVLENLSKKSWEELISAELFKPLGMKSCGFGVTSKGSESTPSQPWGHSRVDQKMSPLQNDNYPFYGPSGTVHCNLLDWQKFLSLHVQGFNGDSTFLKPDTFKKLHSTPAPSETYTFGGWLRLERRWAQGPAFTHSGTNTLNYARTWIAPKRKAILMVVTNAHDESIHTTIDEMFSALIHHFF